MISVNVKTDIDKAIAKLAAMNPKQSLYAQSVALNLTAKDIKREVDKEIVAKIDRPTRFTLAALRIKIAKKNDLVAQVLVKDVAYGKNRMTVDQIIGHQFVNAGFRNHSPIEKWLFRAGYIQTGEYIAPTANATLDANGNLARGEALRMLSQLRAGADPSQYKTGSARSRKSRAKGRYFWSYGDTLSRGLWVSVERGAPLKVLNVIAKPTYRNKVDLKGIGEAVAKREFMGNLEYAIAEAIRTAR